MNPAMMQEMMKGGMNPAMMKGMGGAGKGMGAPIMPPGGMPGGMGTMGNAMMPMGAAGKGDFFKGSTKGMKGDSDGYVVLHNMFDLKEAVAEGPGYWKDLEEDIVEECRKYGKVEHCKIARNSPMQSVYLKFGDDAAASVCMGELHGRQFAGKSVVAEKTTHMEYFNAM